MPLKINVLSKIYANHNTFFGMKGKASSVDIIQINAWCT